MMLEAVWFKDGEEVYKVSPVMNVLCYENMKDISDIEVEDTDEWRTYVGEADDFIIRIKKG